MLPEESSQPTTANFWQKLNRFLFRIHPSITEIGTRREAVLISALSLLFAFLSLVGVSSVLLSLGLTRNVYILSGLAILSIVAYFLSRTPSYKVGSYLIVWALVVIAFSVSDSSRLVNSLISNLIIAFLIASITFPFRYMLFFFILNILAIGALPFIYSDFKDIGIVLGLFVPFSVLLLAVTRYRESVERDRLKESKEVNQELIVLKDELEQRINERTIKLEERAQQLQVVTEVARTAASYQDLDQLLSSSARSISASFGLYHVGIFLIDEEGEFLLLKATNSEGGQRMLARMHALPVDLDSIVGYAAKTQTYRIAVDTDTDSVYFNNPDLPNTHSEIAVPLKTGMRLIGVLDIQSTEKEPFSDEDISILGTLADQLAVAIDNTRLLTETRRALVAAEQTYQRYFSQSWSQFAHRVKQPGYRYQDGIVTPFNNDEANENQSQSNHGEKISIPLKVRGRDIGVLDIQATNAQKSWAPGKLAVLEAAAERAALALESARLLEDAKRRVAKEQIISEASSKINAAINLDNVLQTAIREMGRILPGAEISIQVENDVRPE